MSSSFMLAVVILTAGVLDTFIHVNGQNTKGTADWIKHCDGKKNASSNFKVEGCNHEGCGLKFDRNYNVTFVFHSSVNATGLSDLTLTANRKELVTSKQNYTTINNYIARLSFAFKESNLAETESKQTQEIEVKIQNGHRTDMCVTFKVHLDLSNNATTLGQNCSAENKTCNFPNSLCQKVHNKTTCECVNNNNVFLQGKKCAKKVHGSCNNNEECLKNAHCSNKNVCTCDKYYKENANRDKCINSGISITGFSIVILTLQQFLIYINNK